MQSVPEVLLLPWLLLLLRLLLLPLRLQLVPTITATIDCRRRTCLCHGLPICQDQDAERTKPRPPYHGTSRANWERHKARGGKGGGQGGGQGFHDGRVKGKGHKGAKR